jgi:hypothetical protein
MPQALARAMAEDVAFRRGLPLQALSYMGVANAASSVRRC